MFYWLHVRAVLPSPAPEALALLRCISTLPLPSNGVITPHKYRARRTLHRSAVPPSPDAPPPNNHPAATASVAWTLSISVQSYTRLHNGQRRFEPVVRVFWSMDSEGRRLTLRMGVLEMCLLGGEGVGRLRVWCGVLGSV
jgi:hypothetical protein